MKIFNENDIGKSFKISVSNSMGSDEVTVNVKAIVDLIITPPAKTTYQLFDELNLDGMKVYGVYDDETVEEIFNYSVNDSDFNTHVLDKSICNVGIIYGDIEKSFEVNVLEEIGVNGDNYGFVTEWNAFDGVFNMGSGNFEDKYIVDWGDGVTERFNGTTTCSHTYSVSEPRFIKFYFNKYDLGMSSRTNLKRVLNWNENPSRYYFFGCTNLLSLPENQSMKIPNNISSISLMFNNCRSLVFIPEKLFDDISFIKITNINSIFQGCTSLNSVPSKLFKNFVKLEYTGTAFSGSGIIDVGDDLFCNSILLSNANAIFQNCVNLETVGINLFNNSPNLNDLRYCFNGCIKLRSVGDGFVNSIDLRSFYGFFNGTVVELLPTDLFYRAYLIKDGYELRYSFEYSLSENTIIPEKFFENLLWLESINYVFQNSKISIISNNIFNENISLKSAEYFCYDSKVKTIGENIFKNCRRLWNIRGCFYNCNELEEVSEFVFKDCINLTEIGYCFHGCTKIIEFPDFLFFNQNKLKIANSVFYGCESLINTPKFIFCHSVEVITNLFCSCKNLINFQKESFERAFGIINFDYGNFIGVNNLTFISKDVFKYCLKLRNVELYFNDINTENWQCDLEDGIFNNNIELDNVDIFYDLRYNENIDTFGFNFSQDLFKNNFLINKIRLSVGDLILNKNLFENLICLNDIDLRANKNAVLNGDLIYENVSLEALAVTDKIETIPQTFLLKSIVLKVLSIQGSLSSIPQNFLDNNLKLEAVYFSDTKITSIPSNLFDNNINLKTFRFENCRKLLTIPENLFINNINLESCAYGFYNCKNLSLPANLFNAAAIQSKKPEFYRCFSVDNSADSPIGTAYPLWNNITLTSRNYCYQNCSNLTNFGTIPLYWK